jgi:hypothetical protein
VGWIKDAWTILESIGTLTRDLERANSEVRELRRDVHTLTIAVSRIHDEVEHHKTTNQLVLDRYDREIEHIKESIAGKFDVLLTRLDGRVSDFEHRFSRIGRKSHKRKSANQTHHSAQPE